jgi:hypothetical protein
MNLAKQLRKSGIMFRKRFDFFKYNLMLKRQIGLYDPSSESQMLNETTRSMNLFDFSSGHMADVYLLEDYSDASDFGGETQSSFGLHEENSGVQACMNQIMTYLL